MLGVDTGKMHGLRPKHERFVQEYLKDFNATKAYIRAGYSAKSARQNAHRLLTKDYIQQAIKAKNAEIADKNKDEVTRIRERFEEIAYSKDEIGNYKYSTQMQLKALEKLGKAAGMFSKRIVHLPEIPQLSPEEIRQLREFAAVLDGTACVQALPVESVVMDSAQNEPRPARSRLGAGSGILG